jgi:predicted transcriptional regulator
LDSAGAEHGKRSKLDLYANVLEVVKRFDGGARITRVSYGVGIPVDRLRLLLRQLEKYGFIRQGLGENDEKRYAITRRGEQYLKTYWQLVGLLEPAS